MTNLDTLVHHRRTPRLQPIKFMQGQVDANTCLRRIEVFIQAEWQ